MEKHCEWMGIRVYIHIYRYIDIYISQYVLMDVRMYGCAYECL